MEITELPFNSFIGVERSTNDGFTLALPDDKKYTTHVGTVHASALVALADATSGECLVELSKRFAFDVIPLVRRLETKFRKPANGRVHSKHKIEDGKEEEFLNQLQNKGRSILPVQVEVHGESRTLAITATVDWFVSKK